MPDIYISPETEEKPKNEIKEAKKTLHTRRHKTKSLTAFARQPQNIRFEIQDEEEKIVILVRRHFVTNIPWIVLAVLMTIFPPIMIYIIPFDFVPARYQFIMVIGWYMLTFAFAFERFLSWFFNVNIVTDERIVDIDFPNLLYRDISTTKIDQIQDISVKVGGFIRAVFDYGDVYIQTAGEVPEIRFEAIPHPAIVSKILTDLMTEEEEEKIQGRVR